MRYVRFATAMILLLMIAACGARFQAPEEVAPIEIEGAWMRPALADGNSAVYMNITNNTGNPITLVEVTTEFAANVEIHQTVIENDMAQMQHMANGLRIAADNTINLLPGGYHIMLMNVQSVLSEGDTVTITLLFDNGETITLDVVVSINANVGG